MGILEDFFIEIDRRWKPPGEGLIPFRIIGSAALMLQAGYVRGTKDSDVIETKEFTPEVKKRLMELAGKDSNLHKRFGFYLDIVAEALPFLPQTCLFHPIPGLGGLKHFKAEALDIVDVVVSKLKRFSANDIRDIREMAAKDLLDHKRLLRRFKSAVDVYSTDARAEDLPKYVMNLHTVERDFLDVAESPIDLPGWV